MRMVVPLPSCWKRIVFTPVTALVRVKVLVWLKLRVPVPAPKAIFGAMIEPAESFPP